MECFEKYRLLTEYHAAARRFVFALSRLMDTMDLRARDEEEKLHNLAEQNQARKLVEEMRVHTEEARLAFERHVAEHGC